MYEYTHMSYIYTCGIKSEEILRGEMLGKGGWEAEKGQYEQNTTMCRYEGVIMKHYFVH